MRKKKLGYSDLNITCIGLGTWAIGGGGYLYGWGSQDDNESIRVIQRALDLGVNWIDTAPAYGLGHSEEIVGKAIKGRRDQVILATKCGIVWEEGAREFRQDLQPNNLRREIEESLRRLNVEMIDLFQIHWPIPDEAIEEAWSVIADLIQEGKVLYGGVSNFSIPQIKRIQPIHPVASLQPPYSMLKRGVEEELLAYCAANQIGVIVYSPMQLGLLTGKYNRERLAKMTADDWRRRDADFIEPRFGINQAFIEKLHPIAKRHGRTLSHLAIAWVLRRTEVTAAIVGARRVSQIEETAQAAVWELSDDEISEIEALLVKHDNDLMTANV